MFNKGHKKVIDHKTSQLINISQYAEWKKKFEASLSFKMLVCGDVLWMDMFLPHVRLKGER